MLRLGDNIPLSRDRETTQSLLPTRLDLMPLRCGYIAYLLKISWTEKITNEEVLRMMGTSRGIVGQFKTRKLQDLGHLVRHNTSQLQIIERKIEDRRSRSLPKTTWETDLTNSTGAKYYQIIYLFGMSCL